MTVSPNRNCAIIRALHKLANALKNPSAVAPPVAIAPSVSQTARATVHTASAPNVLIAPPNANPESSSSLSSASPPAPAPALYYVPTAAEHACGGKLYVVTCGLNIRIFYSWENIAPLMMEVSRAVYLAIDDMEEGLQHMINAINNGSAACVTPPV
ncbi:hypothetical protein BDN71DRAFT_1512234 [Pleurotus eryngii]|uniref:Uncharacterized protein n=1 Tax=Pleurotus eryngii TaxID=5323 RepID=A0A9P5ZL09_PLEER|nr:hypothetical protein BDN71DRAFT_1436221 [Pleurotus eryngii]KAF9489332.1 hypothetical protein BDN71DRAFT_1512234 [Pleurotus eryngii]